MMFFLLFCRLSFLGSLLQSESLRQDWLELGLSHDAPQPSDTLTADGQPRCLSSTVRCCHVVPFLKPYSQSNINVHPPS